MSLQESLKNLFDSALSGGIFPGYSAAIVTSSGIVTFFGGNHTYDKMSLPVVESTLYDVASLTKIVGPMSVMMHLVDTGMVGLDDKVSTYLSSFSHDTYKSEATIRNLLTYTLEYNLPNGAKSLMTKVMPDELALRMIELPLKSMPGTSYMYSNITAFLLTQIIEKITKKNFYSLVQEEIFDTFSMSTSTFFPTEEQKLLIPPTEVTEDRGVVQGFVHDESTHHLQSGDISSGAAGLFTTASDIAKFISRTLFFNNVEAQYFSKEMMQNFTTNQFASLLPTVTPLGWGDGNNELISLYPERFVVKGGFTGCFIIGDLKNKVGVVILSNSTYPIRPKDRKEFNKIKQKIIDLLSNK